MYFDNGVSSRLISSSKLRPLCRISCFHQYFLAPAARVLPTAKVQRKVTGSGLSTCFSPAFT
jgi:hypothetical protein